MDSRENLHLETVINNLEMNGNYYQKCTLNYTVGDKHELCKALMKEGVIQEYVVPEKESEWEDETSESVANSINASSATPTDNKE